MRTRLVAVAQVGERDAGQRHLDEGCALMAQRPADSVKLHRQAAGPLQLRSTHMPVSTFSRQRAQKIRAKLSEQSVISNYATIASL